MHCVHPGTAELCSTPPERLVPGTLKRTPRTNRSNGTQQPACREQALNNQAAGSAQLGPLGFTNTMAHLIETIYDTSIPRAINALENTHALIVERAIATQNNIGKNMTMWGAQLKRLEVSLPVGKILIGKSSEKLVEIITRP